MSHRYEIRCEQTGDWAEADTPEAALVAADTLVEDAFEANPTQGMRSGLRDSLTILSSASVPCTRCQDRGYVLPSCEDCEGSGSVAMGPRYNGSLTQAARQGRRTL